LIAVDTTTTVRAVDVIGVVAIETFMPVAETRDMPLSAASEPCTVAEIIQHVRAAGMPMPRLRRSDMAGLAAAVSCCLPCLVVREGGHFRKLR